MNKENIKKRIEADKVTREALGLGDYQTAALWCLGKRYSMDITTLVKQALNEFIKNHCSDSELKQVDQALQPSFERLGYRGIKP